MPAHVCGVCGPQEVIRALAGSVGASRAPSNNSVQDGGFLCVRDNQALAQAAVVETRSLGGGIRGRPADLGRGATDSLPRRPTIRRSESRKSSSRRLRREQNLQDVGISVTALGSDALTDLNITTATDITRAVPSLKMNAYSTSQVVFNVRGVSQNDYGDQQEPPVAVYQDDSYASSINLASFPVFDLARVEVLRGPQGTLFGRNATGGAIQFVSNKPTKEFEGYATLTVGSFNQWITEAAVSGPLSDGWQGRLSAIRNTDDGYMESVIPGVDDRGGNDHYAVRGQLAWQPSDATDVNLACAT